MWRICSKGNKGLSGFLKKRWGCVPGCFMGLLWEKLQERKWKQTQLTDLTNQKNHRNENRRGASTRRALPSVVSVANVSFKRTNLLSERSERNHFMNWFAPFSVQLSSAANMAAGSGTAATHTENCEDVVHVRAVIRSRFANLLHTENLRWGRDSRSRTVLKSGAVSLTHSLRAEELFHVQ